MQTISEIHDISETGAEWEDLSEAMAEMNRQAGREKIEIKKNRRKKKLDWQARTFSRMVSSFRRRQDQLSFF